MHTELAAAGVSVVEDLFKAREPLSIPALYFITPSPSSVDRLLQDWSKTGPGGPMYSAVHIFFTSRWGVVGQGTRSRYTVRVHG